MYIYKVVCEWDIGLSENIYESFQDCHRDCVDALLGCGIEESVDELEDEGLIVFETIEVISTREGRML